MSLNDERRSYLKNLRKMIEEREEMKKSIVKIRCRCLRDEVLNCNESDKLKRDCVNVMIR